jgi:hypothetical protein
MGWRTFRNALQKVHLWAGLFLMVPIVLIGISGSVIVVLENIPDLVLPAATTPGEPQSVASVIAAAEAAVQDAGMVDAVAVPQRSGQPMQVQFGPPPGTRRANPNLNTGKTVFVDPVSLKILGETERRRAGAFRRTLTTLHVAMMAPGYFGLQFVGWMGVAMVLFGISGLVLWWPKKGQWRLAFGVKKGTRGFRLNRDLHGAAGFWSLGVFLILSISGVDLAFPVTFQNMVGAFLPLDSGVFDGTLDEATIASIATRNALTVDDAAKLALAAVPDARLLSIQLPPGGVDQVLSFEVIPALGRHEIVSEAKTLSSAMARFDRQLAIARQHRIREPGFKPSACGNDFAALYCMEYGDGIHESEIEQAREDVRTAITTFFSMEKLMRRLQAAQRLVAQQRLIFAHTDTKVASKSPGIPNRRFTSVVGRTVTRLPRKFLPLSAPGRGAEVQRVDHERRATSLAFSLRNFSARPSYVGTGGASLASIPTATTPAWSSSSPSSSRALKNPACPRSGARRSFRDRIGCFRHRQIPAIRPRHADKSWSPTRAS